MRNVHMMHNSKCGFTPVPVNKKRCTYDMAVAEVLKVKEDGPAAAAGVAAQDQIVAVDGVGVDGQPADVVHQMLADAATSTVRNLFVDTLLRREG